MSASPPPTKILQQQRGVRTTSGHPAHTSSPDADAEPALDVDILRQRARCGLTDALDQVSGPKTLVIDPGLAGPLGLVTEVSLLKHHGVDKMFWLEPGPFTSSTPAIIYLSRPSIRHMKLIATQIAAHLSSTCSSASTNHTYTLLLAPRSTSLCERVLEEEGVRGQVDMLEYPLEFIPLEEDVLSLELEGVAREVFLEGDTTPIFYAAKALTTLQKAYGLFPRIVGKGDAAAKLASLLHRMRLESLADDPTDAALTTPSSTIDSLIIVDRTVDLVTPLCTQLTYEGLIDEFFGIRNSHVNLPPSLSTSSSQPTTSLGSTSTSTSPPSTSASATPAQNQNQQQKKKKHLLRASHDPLFADLRDLNFSQVGAHLNRTAKRINEDYEGRHQAKTVQQIREFVGKLGGLQSEHQALRLHTGLSEEILSKTRTDEFNVVLEIQQNLLAGYEPSAQVAAIETLVQQEVPLHTVLRLLCLASLTGGGIKPKVLENLKREILQTYGFHHLPLVLALPRLALLHRSPLPASVPSFPFPALRKALRLIVDDVDERAPNDISYVYSGYAPLSVRLVQCVAQKAGVLSSSSSSASSGGAGARLGAHPIVGWKGFEDAVKGWGGETVDERPSGEEGKDAEARRDRLPGQKGTVTVVMFVGGVTFTEISALRLMSRQTRGRKFVVATTNIIAGDSFLNELVPPLPESAGKK